MKAPHEQESCLVCGKTAETMFRVGPLDKQGGVVMCGTCWRAGIDPEQVIRTRSLRSPEREE